MTGPEHYREAERLIEPGEHDEQEMHLVLRDFAAAQVHAMLALAAATALCQVDANGTAAPDEHLAWHRIAGTRRPRDTDEYGTGEPS